MNIYVLDKNFNLVTLIDEYISIIWTRRYFTYGDFELYLSATKSNLDTLQQGYYLVREKDVTVTEYRNVMIISSRKITTDEQNGDNLTVTGFCLKSILKRRVVAEQTNLNGQIAACIRQLVTENIISPTVSARAISNFTLGTDSITLTDSMQMQITGDNLSDAITEICTTYGLGYDIYISGSNFVFYLYQGADRSYNQAVNPHVVFSTEFDNLISSEYVNNRDNYANVAVVAGEGEGTARKKVTVGTASGLERLEIWVDARNASTNDGEITEAEYNQMLAQDGVEALAETDITTAFSGEIDNSVNYTYGVDYFLGDLVQIENDYNISAATRIIEVIDSEDDSGANLILTFSEMEV